MVAIACAALLGVCGVLCAPRLPTDIELLAGLALCAVFARRPIGVPLLALDMYEHSFHMDYGTAAAKYVDAFFRNIDWEVVDRRYAAALRGGG